MVWAADARAGMFHVLQEKVCRLKKKGFSTVLWIYGYGDRKKVLSWFSCSGKKVHMVNTSNKSYSGRWELEEEQNQCLLGQAAAATFGLLHGRHEFDSFPKTAWKLQAAEKGTPPWFSCFSLNSLLLCEMPSVPPLRSFLREGQCVGTQTEWSGSLSALNFMQGWGTCSACCGHICQKRKPSTSSHSRCELCIGEASVFLPMAKVSLSSPWLPPALSWVIRILLGFPPSPQDWMEAVAGLCADNLFNKAKQFNSFLIGSMFIRVVRN